MTKLLLLCFGIMFSLYGYDYLFSGSLSDEATFTKEEATAKKAQSFTERISSDRKAPST